jgi:excinuclease UvrABC ATPase subunit
VVRDAAIKPTANVLPIITVTCTPNNTKTMLSKSVLEMSYWKNQKSGCQNILKSQYRQMIKASVQNLWKKQTFSQFWMMRIVSITVTTEVCWQCKGKKLLQAVVNSKVRYSDWLATPVYDEQRFFLSLPH